MGSILRHKQGSAALKTKYVGTFQNANEGNISRENPIKPFERGFQVPVREQLKENLLPTGILKAILDKKIRFDVKRSGN